MHVDISWPADSRGFLDTVDLYIYGFLILYINLISFNSFNFEFYLFILNGAAKFSCYLIIPTERFLPHSEDFLLIVKRTQLRVGGI